MPRFLHRRPSLLWIPSLVIVAVGAAWVLHRPGLRGDRAWARGDWAMALEAWSAASRLGPERRQRMARALASEGNLPGARAALVGEDPLTPDGWMVKGLLALEDGLPEDAVLAFQAGVDAGGDPSLRVNLCSALLAVGRPDLSVCTQALLAAPQDVSAILGFAAASLESGSSVVGVRALHDVLRSPMASSDQILEAATLLSMAGEAESACVGRLEAMKRASRLSVVSIAGGSVQTERLGSVQGRLETARLCASTRHYGEARAVLASIDDGTVEVDHTLGMIALEQAASLPSGQERQGRIDEARRRLAASSSFSGASPGNWHNNMGRLLALDGDPVGAEAAYRQALALEPGSSETLVNLSRLLQAAGRADEALVLAAQVWDRAGPARLVAGLDLVRWQSAEERWPEVLDLGRSVLEGCTATGATPCIVEVALRLSAAELALGLDDAAFGHLGLALQTGGQRAREEALADPAFGPLQDDLRFRQLLDRVVGPEASRAAGGGR